MYSPPSPPTGSPRQSLSSPQTKPLIKSCLSVNSLKSKKGRSLYILTQELSTQESSSPTCATELLVASNAGDCPDAALTPAPDVPRSPVV